MKYSIPAKLTLGGILLLASEALLCTGCTGPVSALTVYIDPSSATVTTGQQQSFSVRANNEVITAGILWEVNGIGGGNATFGTITASGLYTAPAVAPTPNTVTVSATQQGTTNSLSATVTIVAATPVTPSASVSVSPSTIPAGGTATLTWSSAGVISCQINQESNINGIAVGTAGSTPVSPALTTPYQLNCTGSNGSASAEATLTVQSSTAGVVVSITPTSATLASGASMSFAATVVNDPSARGVQWASSLGAAPVATGLLTATYTAPTVTQNTGVQITASSVADPSATAAATVTVVPSGGGGGGGCTSPPPSSNPPQAGVSPELINIAPGASQIFIATLSGDNVTSQAFTWSLNTLASASEKGTITPDASSSNTATYQAADVTSLVTIQVIATSAQYTCITASATVDVAPQ